MKVSIKDFFSKCDQIRRMQLMKIVFWEMYIKKLATLVLANYFSGHKIIAYIISWSENKFN